MQTLEELKQENAQAESEAEDNTAVIEEEDQAEAVEDEAEETQEVAELAEEETEESETEAWMQADDEASENDDRKYSGADIGAAKAKLRAKLERQKEDELSEMRAEIERLKGAQQTQHSQELPPRPQLNDFETDEDYESAMNDWDDLRLEKKLSDIQQRSQHKSNLDVAKQLQESALDDHYKRAAELEEKHGVKADLYRQADLSFRQSIESVVQGGGDAIADALIAKLGEGSEKVVYMVGKNRAKQAEFQKALLDDPSGLQAGIYLGMQLKESTAPKRVNTQTPKPAPNLKGDTINTGVDDFKKRLSKAKTAQEEYNVRKEARLAGHTLD